MKNKKKNYDQLADRILELMGNKENITFFAHCMTRLRFNVKDKGLVKEDEIDKLENWQAASGVESSFRLLWGMR